MASPIDATKAVAAGQMTLPDPRDINYFEADEDTHAGYQNALRSALSSLEQRYAQPNLWKVAAAFFKPQLGGFAASLGSANEAMGENLELQRANELPIAQLRAQLAAQQIGAKQNQKAAELYKEFIANGGDPKDLGDLSERLNAIAPNAPVSKSVTSRYESMRKERELASSELRDAAARVQTAQMLHMPIPQDALEILQRGSPTIKRSPAAPPVKQSNVAPALEPKEPEFVPDENGTMIRRVVPPKTITGEQSPTGESIIPAQNLSPLGGEPLPLGAADKTGQKPVTSEAEAKQVKSAEAFTPLSPSGDISYDKLTQAQKDAVNNMLINSKLRPIMGTDTGRESWETNIAKLQKDPERLKNFITAINNEGRKISGVDEKSSAPKSDEKFPVLHRFPSKEELYMKPEDEAKDMRAAATNQASQREKYATAIVDTFAPFGNPALYKPYVQSLKKVETLIQEDTASAAKVHNILGSGELKNQIKAAIEKGGTVNVAGGVMSGTFGISLPAKVWEQAGLPKGLYTYANRLATEYAKQALLEARMSGANISNMPVAQFSAMMTSHPNMDMEWKAALDQVKDKKLDAIYKNKIYGVIQSDLNKKIPKEELAPYASVLEHSQDYKILQQAWDHEKKLLEKNFKSGKK